MAIKRTDMGLLNHFVMIEYYFPEMNNLEATNRGPLKALVKLDEIVYVGEPFDCNLVDEKKTLTLMPVIVDGVVGTLHVEKGLERFKEIFKHDN